MIVAVVASVVGLGCLLLGLWVGWQAGRSAEYERAWRDSVGAERESRDEMGVEIGWYRDQAAIACREQDSE